MQVYDNRKIDFKTTIMKMLKVFLEALLGRSVPHSSVCLFSDPFRKMLQKAPRLQTNRQVQMSDLN